MIKARLLLILVVFLLAVPVIYSAGGATTTASQTAAGVSVSVIPSKLPADGSTYSSVVVSLVTSGSKPTIALVNTTVFLSVSQSNVGTLPGSVTIPAGQTFVIANFTTTSTPGVTTITASSAGLTSSSTQLTTATPSGFPDHIQVFATPSTLLARPHDTGTLILELTDDQGLPAKAPANLNVSLFSSNTNVVSLSQDQLTISANQSLATGLFETSYSPGSPTITASASGYISGSTTINVVGPAPLQLIASAQPSSLVLNTHGLLMIALTDESGDPARAPTPINVTLRSSNTTVATVPNSVEIPAGSIYASVSYSSTSVAGTATLTATSPGLGASIASIKTSAGTSPVNLDVLINPSTVLSDNSRYDNTTVVELMGANSEPAVASGSGYVVSLSSSNSQVGSVPSTVTIPPGSSYAVAYFQATYASGTTTITASASNLNSAEATMVTFGPVPYQISLSIYGSSAQKSAGTELPADGGSYQALAVTLLDSSGGPAIAPENISIQLSSSETNIVSVDPVVTISQGSIGTLVFLQTSTLAGSANLTAASSSLDLVPGTLTVVTEIPAPTKLAAFLAPATVLQPKTGNAPYLYIQLQDSNGNPARARVPTSVVVTSSNPALFNTSMTLTIPQGQDYARLQLNPLGVGSATLTATSAGLASANAPLQVLSFALSANLTLSQPGFIYANETDYATLHITLLGQPLSHVNVTWDYNNAVPTPTNGTTNAAGIVTTQLRPVQPGSANITATATGALFGKIQVTAQFSILAIPPKPRPTLAQDFLSYVYYIIILVAAVVVASVYLLRRRRKHAKAELEAGFEAVS